MLRLMFLVAALTCSESFAFKVNKADGCIINMKQLNPEPLVLIKGTNQFLYPDLNQSTIVLAVGDQIDIACPGGTVLAPPSPPIPSKVTATCTSTFTLNINGFKVPFAQISCSVEPTNTARYTNKSCELNGKEVEIGFDIDEKTFVRQIRLCFDSVGQNTLYSQYTLTKSIAGAEYNVPRPNFTEDNFYNVGNQKVNSLYSKYLQRININALVGLDPASTKYIQNQTNLFLARGHLTAKADFYYGPQQKATFHLVNVAPQWQEFNEKNWALIEKQVRYFMEDYKLDLEVYTGTYGVTTLPHEETGEDVELYLYINGTVKGLPVPKLYWKVVYDPVNKLGVALVGANNPYITEMSKSVICTDISKDISWIDWRGSNATFGFIYACTVDDLRLSVKQLPSFDVNGILTSGCTKYTSRLTIILLGVIYIFVNKF